MQVSGELTSDSIWEGDVRLEGDVVVPAGITLRLRAGTTLSFAEKPRWSCAVFRSAPEGYPIESSSRERCDLVVFGRLEIEGSAARPVALGDRDGQWGGVALLGRAVARVEHARVRGAAGGEDALFQCFDDSRLELRGGTLSRARVGVLAWGLSSVSVHETFVEDVGCAFFCREGSVTELFRVRCLGCEQGVWCQNWALARLEDCRLESCSDFGAGAYDRSRLTVVRGRFESCRQGLLAASHASASALAAEFERNRVGVQGIESASLSLRGCAISASVEQGAKFSQSSRASVVDCRFKGNRLAAVFSENDARVSASECEFEEPAAVAERP